MHISQAAVLAGAGTQLQVRRDAVTAALLAACLGALLIVGVGFGHLEGIHDAAHDSRHAIGFPCH